jgi:3D (Asp-Asp-Asp) domain-containing protein
MKRITILAAAMVLASIPSFTAKADISPSVLENIALKAVKTLTLKVTAYASVPDETDDTPFITANGTYVHDGIVATNLLPFGTKIKIPSLFGDKIFVVEDRMNQRMKNGLDIWMADRSEAIQFGANYAKVIVLQQKTPTEVSESKTNEDDL